MLASDRQGSNFESCVWRTVSSQSSHHPQEVLLAQFSLYVHKGGLKPDSFHFIFVVNLVKFLRASRNLSMRKVFLISNLNSSSSYMICTTTPQSFIALGFFIGTYKKGENKSFHTSWIIQSVPGCCQPD